LISSVLGALPRKQHHQITQISIRLQAARASTMKRKQLWILISIINCVCFASAAVDYLSNEIPNDVAVAAADDDEGSGEQILILSDKTFADTRNLKAAQLP